MNSPLSLTTSFSRYAQRLLTRFPDWEEPLSLMAYSPYEPEAMQQYINHQPLMTEDDLKQALRGLRQRVFVTTMVRDLAGFAPLKEIVLTQSHLADLCLKTAVRSLTLMLAATYGKPIGSDSGNTQELIIIGMGKLGSKELNVSSDIDLIFAYEEDGETDGPKKIANHEYFTLLGRKVIQAISDPTADGIVFRVDMRLRPYGDSGPLVMSLPMLEEYLMTQGRMWERFAWMKARAITGPSENLTQLIRPFVFRKYLDYGAYAGIRELHGQIRREVSRQDRADNIKLGPGGIREIEFIAQIFQLIRGGRDSALQVRGTLEALPLLADKEFLPQEAVTDLLAAYDFLRKLEHRLQYRDDQQTQTLPNGAEDRLAIAKIMGFEAVEPFVEALGLYRKTVSHHFDEVFSTPEDQSSHPLMGLWQGQGDDAAEQLYALGFKECEELAQHLDGFRQSPRIRQLPAGNRQRLDQLMPRLIKAASRESKPDQTLRRLMHLMENIARRESYLALLTEYPQTLERVSALYNASPWVSNFLTQHPLLLDELLDTRLLYKAPDWPALAQQLKQQLDELDNDIEAQMNTMREFHHTQTFRLVASDLADLLPLETLSDHLSALADLILQESLHRCWLDVRTRHRETPAFAIIGYGKLGAKEIGYDSDLDIIFLFDDDASDAQENYTKLAKKLSNWLTTLTRAGTLYEVDLRLRPNGASGLLVSSIAAFEHYQTKEAWAWEYQALTRARFCAGDTNVGDQFEIIRRRVLVSPREGDALRTEVMNMRQKMVDNHKDKEGVFDVKHGKGGLIDLEFAVQYLILQHSATTPGLLDNVGNIALLGRSANAGLIPENTALAAANAYRKLRQVQHTSRLAGTEAQPLNDDSLQEERTAISTLWQQVFGESRK